MKPYLFFDLDETMFLTLEHMVNYINGRHGINSTIYDHIGNNDSLDEVIRKHDPNFNLSWGETYAEMLELIFTHLSNTMKMFFQ